MPTIRQVWLLVQPGNYALFIDLTDAYLHIPIVKHHCLVLQFVWYHLISERFSFWVDFRVFSTLTKPIHFFCHYKGLGVIIYLDYILVLTHSMHAVKRVQSLVLSFGLSWFTY